MLEQVYKIKKISAQKYEFTKLKENEQKNKNKKKIIDINSRKYPEKIGINKIIDHIILHSTARTTNTLMIDAFKNCKLFDIYLKENKNKLQQIPESIKKLIDRIILESLRKRIRNRIITLKNQGVIDITRSFVLENNKNNKTQEITEEFLLSLQLIQRVTEQLKLNKPYTSLFGEEQKKFYNKLNELLQPYFPEYKIKYWLINIKQIKEYKTDISNKKEILNNFFKWEQNRINKEKERLLKRKGLVEKYNKEKEVLLKELDKFVKMLEYKEINKEFYEYGTYYNKNNEINPYLDVML